MAREIVTPGELLGIEEEFFGNEKTYAEEGNVYSMVLGEKRMLNKQVQIVSPKFARMLKKGDIVVGRVEDLYDSVSLIVIESMHGSKTEREAIGKTYCYMRITEIARGAGYIKNFRQFIKIGDILKAIVIEITPLGTYLSIADEGFGVLKAHCSLCHSKLAQHGRILQCDSCGNKENRKLAMV
ncbi:MAG: exosome complex RNA-binding protein Csl4 [Candidatus Micrarchaeota archaeon]